MIHLFAALLAGLLLFVAVQGIRRAAQYVRFRLLSRDLPPPALGPARVGVALLPGPAHALYESCTRLEAIILRAIPTLRSVARDIRDDHANLVSAPFVRKAPSGVIAEFLQTSAEVRSDWRDLPETFRITLAGQGADLARLEELLDESWVTRSQPDIDPRFSDDPRGLDQLASQLESLLPIFQSLAAVLQHAHSTYRAP